MAKILWVLIGYILQVIGNIFKKSNVLFLGYYLAGTGNTRSLPEYFDDLLVSIFAGIEMEDGETCIIKPHDVAHHTQDKSLIAISNMLYETTGKFTAKREGDVIYINDYYIFYPICLYSDTHFHNCNCPDSQKQYLHLTRDIRIPRLLYKITEWLHYKSDCFCKYIIESTDFELILKPKELSISISDHFWVRKGKPFNTHYELPVA